MESFNLNLMMFIAMMVAILQFPDTVAQTRHIVGGSLGWTIPSGGPNVYTTWASGQKYYVDDLLVFNFTDGEDDVAEVSAAAYGPCTATNPISLSTNGPTTITLTSAGTHYYICTFRSHCQIGQKLTINVSEAASATPPPTIPRTPVSPPTITPPPPSVRPRTPVSPPVTTRPPPPEAPATVPFPPCPRITSPGSDQSSPPTTTPGRYFPPPPPPSGGAPSFAAMLPSTLLMLGVVFLNY